MRKVVEKISFTALLATTYVASALALQTWTLREVVNLKMQVAVLNARIGVATQSADNAAFAAALAAKAASAKP